MVYTRLFPPYRPLPVENPIGSRTDKPASSESSEKKEGMDSRHLLPLIFPALLRRRTKTQKASIMPFDRNDRNIDALFLQKEVHRLEIRIRQAFAAGESGVQHARVNGLPHQ